MTKFWGKKLLNGCIMTKTFSNFLTSMTLKHGSKKIKTLSCTFSSVFHENKSTFSAVSQLLTYSHTATSRVKN